MSEESKSFELAVAAALRMSGFQVEAAETLVGHKKADLVATTRRLARSWTVVVECKSWSRHLSKDDLIKIWIDYQPLVENGLADEILLVTKEPLTPAADTYARSVRGLSSLTYSALLADAFDFSEYLRALAEGFDRSPDGIANYYVDPRTVDGEFLDELVHAWIAGTDTRLPVDRPIAILGAYGIGKSSYATKLSSQLAQDAQRNPTSRIPILVRLQEIGGEQSLEGLLGKHFTATHFVRGYQFDLFVELNRSGRLVIILDGFDEMKRLLTWREFRHNLAELNRLVVPNSRVIILGRPTAFENDEEHEFALHGIRHLRSGVVHEPGWPDYSEIEMGNFTTLDMKSFLLRYFEASGEALDEESPEFVSLWDRVTSRQLRDLARRPVQLRMLAEVLPSFAGSMDELGLSTVYGLFVDDIIRQIIDREEAKNARLAFSSKDRRKFAGEVAYWLWIQREPFTTTEKIPDSIVSSVTKTGDIEAARRDLVSGSPLDRRLGERLGFAHRSIQEFFVAEELLSRLRSGETPLGIADQIMTEEILTFLRDMLGPGDSALRRSLMRDYRGLLRYVTAELFAVDPSYCRSLVERVEERRNHKPELLAPWEMIALAMNARASKAGRAPEALGQALRLFAKSDTDPTGTSSLLGIFVGLLGDVSPADPFRVLMLSIGTLEEFSAAQLSGHKLIADGELLAEERRDYVRVCRQVGPARVVIGANGDPVFVNGRYQVTGGRRVQLQWLPQIAIDVGRNAHYDWSRLHISGLRSVFQKHLAAVAGFSDLPRSVPDSAAFTAEGEIAWVAQDVASLNRLFQRLAY